MTFETAAKLIKQKLTKLGYKFRTSDDCDLFYLDNYYSINLFKIEYKYKSIYYASHPKDHFWTPVYTYDFSNLKELYVRAKQHYLAVKEQKIKDKLKELEKDFQDG